MKTITISVFLDEVLLSLRHEWSHGYKEQLRVSIRCFARWAGSDVGFGDLTAQRVAGWLAALKASGRSVRTVNNKRCDLFAVWQSAHEMGIAPTEPPRRLVRVAAVPRRRPRAWTLEEMARLLNGCRAAPTRRGWGARHWEALVSVIYDTSLRLGCLLASSVDQFDSSLRELRVPAELMKGGEEAVHTLHPHTAELLNFERPDRRLFPWPYHRHDIWPRFRRDVLLPAGLPCGRRDQFHKIRRTSYTQVYKRFGLDVASRHACHRTNMSRYYLDETLLDMPDPLDALPRPA